MSAEPTDRHSDGCRDCGAFFVEVLGKFARSAVSVNWTDKPWSADEDTRDIIEQAWQEELLRAQQAGRHVYDGQLSRLMGFTCHDQRLDLTLGPVSFKDFIGTNAVNAHLRHVHGPEFLADPLGVSAALVSADGLMILGCRSDQVSQYAGRIHPVGGIVEAATVGDGPGGDPFATMLTELTEETTLAGDEVSQITCLGLVRDRHTYQPEMIFDVNVSVEADEIFRRYTQATDSSEHSELITVRNHPAAAETFIEDYFNSLTPITLAVLMLHGLSEWGTGWFATARSLLRHHI